MTHGIRIKSKKRFFIFIVICMVIFTAIFNGIIGGYEAVASDKTQDYISVNVQPGDTLWDIAQNYMPEDMDTREAVYIIKKINDIESSIAEGQTIYIPEYS